MPKKNATNVSLSRSKERDDYGPIKSTLEEWLREKAANVYVELTADTKFSEALKAAIPQGRESIFHFLQSSRPDMTGSLTNRSGSTHFIITEIKQDALKLEDMDQ
jgi:hypothetical protein